MSAAFEQSDKPALATITARPTWVAAIRSRLDDLWPRVMLAFGGVLTVIWAGTLGWLLLAVTGVI